MTVKCLIRSNIWEARNWCFTVPREKEASTSPVFSLKQGRSWWSETQLFTRYIDPKTLGVESPFFSTIVFSKNRIRFSGFPEAFWKERSLGLEAPRKTLFLPSPYCFAPRAVLLEAEARKLRRSNLSVSWPCWGFSAGVLGMSPTPGCSSFFVLHTKRENLKV